MRRLIRAELMKIRTTNTWWIFLIGAFAATAAALAIWILVANNAIDTAVKGGGEVFVPPSDQNVSPAGVEEMRRQFELAHDLGRTLVTNATNIYTSGQFFGLMFAMLLGTLLITNEYYHQTATATFLTTPRRTQVIAGKLATAMLAAAFFWLFSTVVSVAAGSAFFGIKGYAPQLGEWTVIRAILLNALAYGLWGVLGVGLGVLLRSQIGAVITGTVAYVIGTFLIQNIFGVLYFVFGWHWLVDAMVVWPGVASQVMISAEPPFSGSPPWWVGGLVLAGYGVVFGLIGTWITRRRDIS
ncbi:MAG TPA: ABC transporter permease [Micromonosporaceae bacterium]|jgi:ABC-type transport system involved in multi-copper enzyme maturation permease subunit